MASAWIGAGVAACLIAVVISLYENLGILCISNRHGQQVPANPASSSLGVYNDDVPVLPDYELAYRESFGYFTNIPSSDWELLRNITLKRVNNHFAKSPLYGAKRPQTWYQNNWDPDFSCRHDTRVPVGYIGDGGKWVCDPLRLIRKSRSRKNKKKREYRFTNTTQPGCIVYSIGSNGNFMFEEGIIDLLGEDTCEIHTFDFTDFSKEANIPRQVHFHARGLKPSYQETDTAVLGTGTAVLMSTGVENEINQLHGQLNGNGQAVFMKAEKDEEEEAAEFKTLEETMEVLGHTALPIDIFKVDCEGCEWKTYRDWLKADLRQILVEVHKVPPAAQRFFEDLQRAGYVTYHKEPNIEFGNGECIEYAMMKLDKSYVEDRLKLTGPYRSKFST